MFHAEKLKHLFLKLSSSATVRILISYLVAVFHIAFDYKSSICQNSYWSPKRGTENELKLKLSQSSPAVSLQKKQAQILIVYSHCFEGVYVKH